MATFETSFYQQAKPFEIESPVKQYATLAQLRMLQDQAASANLSRRKTEQDFERQNQLRDLYSRYGSDQAAMRDQMVSRGFLPEVQALDKQRLENEDKAANIAKHNAEAQKLKAAQFRDLAAQMTPDEAGYEQFKAQGVAAFGPQFAARFPAYTPDWQARAIATADEKFKANKPIMKEVNDGQRTFFVDVNPVSNPAIKEFAAQMQMTPAQIAQDQRALQQLAEQMRHNRTTEGISGGHLALARQKEAREATAPRGQYDAERGLMVDPRTGTASPVTMGGAPIGPKEKVPTESELTSAGYAGRMQNAEVILGKLPANADRAGLIERTARAAGQDAAANIGMSAARQQYRQAQEDWVRAKLRKESGAVIADTEMEREIQTYFPMIGDSAAVVAQKGRARQQAMEQMKTTSNRAKIPGSVEARPEMGNFRGARPPLEAFQR